MVDYELAHWVNQQRMNRYSDDQIRSYLLKYGYNEKVIDEAMNFIDAHNKNEMKMGNPPFAGGIKIGTDHYETMAVICLVSLFFFPLIALPLGILSLKHIKHNPHLKGKAFAILGIIIGGFILFIILLYISLILFAIFGSVR